MHPPNLSSIDTRHPCVFPPRMTGVGSVDFPNASQAEQGICARRAR
jgi:hypothetical protein